MADPEDRTLLEDLLVRGVRAQVYVASQLARLVAARVASDPHDRRAVAMGLIGEALLSGLVEAGRVGDNGFIPSDCSASQTLVDLADDWTARHVETISHRVLLRNTGLGDALAKAVLEREQDSSPPPVPGDKERLADIVKTSVSIALNLLAGGEYDTLERVTRGRHMSAEELRAAVDEYPAHLVRPPMSAWDFLEVHQIVGADPAEFEVCFDLWSEEEGVSDLTMVLQLTEVRPGLLDIAVETVHVL